MGELERRGVNPITGEVEHCVEGDYEDDYEDEDKSNKGVDDYDDLPF